MFPNGITIQSIFTIEFRLYWILFFLIFWFLFKVISSSYLSSFPGRGTGHGSFDGRAVWFWDSNSFSHFKLEQKVHFPISFQNKNGRWEVGGDMHFLLEPQTPAYFILNKKKGVLPSLQFTRWPVSPRLGMFLAIFSLGGISTDEIQCAQGPLVMEKNSRALPEGLNCRKSCDLSSFELWSISFPVGI